MPLITVCPPSGSAVTRNEGSSSASRAERDGELVLIGLGLGLDRDLDHRIRELHPLQHNRVRRVAQGFARGGVLEAGDGHDVARPRLLDILAGIRVHEQHPADPLLAALGAVEHLLAGLDHARIDAHESERADEGVGHHLEGKRRQRLVVAAGALDLIALAGHDAVAPAARRSAPA